MNDHALTDWLSSGARVELTAAEAASRRHNDFSRRFVEAMNPPGDLGSTEEEHQLAVARRVYEVHLELNALGEEEYFAVWWTFDAPRRRAIKAYVEMADKVERSTPRR